MTTTRLSLTPSSRTVRGAPLNTPYIADAPFTFKREKGCGLRRALLNEAAILRTTR